MMISEKKIMKSGNSLVVTLTEELRRIGAKKGEHINVRTDGKYIVISRKKDKVLEGKLISIDSTLWERIKYLSQKYTDLTPEMAVIEALEEWCKKYSSILSRPIIKI